MTAALTFINALGLAGIVTTQALILTGCAAYSRRIDREQEGRDV